MPQPALPLWPQQLPVTVLSSHFGLVHKGRIKVQPFPASSWQRFQSAGLRAGMMINWTQLGNAVSLQPNYHSLLVACLLLRI